MRRPVGLLLGALALTACAAPILRWAGLPTQKEAFLRTSLDNGLKVILVEDHAAPVVALNVWVRTGSADERADEAGMAHVFEHMLFKGTERRAVGEIARTVEAAGGHINAFTSFDMTVYHITMASRDVGEGVDVLADAVQHSTFDPDELAKESKVVVEEIRRGEDSPGRVLSQAIFGTAYTRHPYRLPVIGTEESVLGFTREQLLGFFRRWYTPDNMTFVAVGDFDTEKMLSLISQSFEGAQTGGKLAHPRESEVEQNGTRTVLLRRDFEQTLLGIAYPITSMSDPDTPYLDLLSSVLGGGESSRLYRNVKDRLRIVHTIDASAYTPQDAGLFMVDAALDPKEIENAIAAITLEIEKLRSEGPSTIELERARVNLLAHEVREKETMQGQARKFGYFEAIGGGIEAEAVYLDRVRKATTDDLKAVAARYLTPERATVAVLLGEGERPELDEAGLLAASRRAAATARSSESVQELGSGIRLYQLPNGLRIVVKPNRNIPLVALRLSFLGGLLAETESTQGITSFLAGMLDRGTEQRSAAQFAAEVEGIAAGIGGFAGRNSFGMTAEFLSESLDVGLDLFADMLLRPAFADDEIEKAREETLAALERREDHLAGKAFELFSKGLYPNHPYRFPSIGTADTIRSFDREALTAYFEKYARPQNAVLGIVGDVDPDAIVAAIASQLADWEGGDKVELPERSAPVVPAAAQTLELEKGKQQIHLVVGFSGLSLSDPDLPALEVLTQVLSGQGGRLFLELRDRRSLAYSVMAFSIEGLDTGSFGVYIASAPQKLQESLDGVNEQLRLALETPITAEEIKRAKAFLIGSQAVSLQRFGAQASLLSLDELYGLGATHHLDYESGVEAVGLDDVNRVARRVIKLDTPVIALVK